ncbi:MAG: LUD domain-containing protein [Candidatus Acidiferrum sp.]|jgi:iron-sulfur cluster protein
MPKRVTSPREVAAKESRAILRRAIRLALDTESAAVRHNTRSFNLNRYRATAALPDYDALKDEARRIKEHALVNRKALVQRLSESVTRNGGHFFFARDAQEAGQYIQGVCKRHCVRSLVKGKSMTSEEIHLNGALEHDGIRVVETDLAEFILQAADEQPSHIIAPAIHYSRERITALFRRKFQTDLPLDTGEDLTRFARERLRQDFLAADAGITGANLVSADCGSLLLVESEANIRLTCIAPPLHIALSGLEKIVPSRREFASFIELLAASATGQPLTSYTSVIRPPLAVPVVDFRGAGPATREFHLVIVDNGREALARDAQLKEALYCIRCSACLNSCANFQVLGGHGFGGATYSGGIGATWEAATTGQLKLARFSDLCTGCSRCVPQCPVRIDIPGLNVELRSRLNKSIPLSLTARAMHLLLGASPVENASAQQIFFAHYDRLARWGTLFAPLSNFFSKVPGARWFLEKSFGIDRRRHLAPFPRKTWVDISADEVTEKPDAPRGPGVLVLADVFTNYGAPERGKDALRCLRAAGVRVRLTKSLPDGRAALSQGMIDTARAQAETLSRYIAAENAAERPLLVVEPSVLAMILREYRKLLPAEAFVKLQNSTIDLVQFLARHFAEQGSDPRAVFNIRKFAPGPRVFYHAHCQQRAVSDPSITVEFLRRLGFEVTCSQVECCGMAGSFGYKKDFYDVSQAVSEELVEQWKAAESAKGPHTLLASGVSCIEQLQGATGRAVLHPVELLAKLL